jgi:hypothetical protein
MKEDPAHGIKGAVVLENRWVFTGIGIRRVLRIRILSGHGMEAAELDPFLPEAKGIEGRTVQPDGNATLFSSREEFISKTRTWGHPGRTRPILVPPGLTGDCLVELTWSGRRGIPRVADPEEPPPGHGPGLYP